MVCGAVVFPVAALAAGSGNLATERVSLALQVADRRMAPVALDISGCRLPFHAPVYLFWVSLP